jgi:hypothetical protein
LTNRLSAEEIVDLMANHDPRPIRCLWAILFILALGLSHGLLAQTMGQTPLSAPLQAQVQSGNDQGVIQDQPAPASAPATSQTQPTTSPDQTKPADAPSAVQSGTTTNSKHPKNDRIFFALPNYLTIEESAVLPPMTTREKFKTVAEGCFDPVEVVFIGIEAGIGQADNTNPTYHQGFIGYSKRFGTAYADAIIGNFGTGAIFPTLLRQDPRYYQRGKGNFFRRAAYAGGRVLFTRSDSSGKVQFNFSEFLGNGLAAGLANAYHPEPHTLASNADVLGTQVLLDVAGYELKEFWPDIHRFLLRFRHKP